MTHDSQEALPETALTTLAILKVNWDRHGRDHISNFVPFVADVLRELPHREIALGEVQEKLAKSWGLAIPNGPLQIILERARKDGLVEVVDGIYSRTRSCEGIEPLVAARDQALRDHDTLIAKLVAFARERHGLDWTEEQADDSLLQYVSEKTGPILAARFRGAPLGREKPEDVDLNAYVVNTFVLHLYERDAAGFGYLETVVKGSMLAHALYVSDIGAVDRRLAGVEVYFDTRLMIEALIGNAYQKRVRRELFSLVYELGGRLYVFDDTFDEINGVLTREERRLRRGTVTTDRHYGVLTHQLVADGFEASDIELIRVRLRKILLSMQIDTKTRPKPAEALTVDEPKLARMLAEGREQEADAPQVIHDMDAITAVHRLRNGRRRHDLSACKAVFVTTNYPMVEACRQFFREEYDIGGVPHCYSDKRFETLVWLKKPLLAPDLPRRRIMADCLAALRPSDELWFAYSAEIERLRSQEALTVEDVVLLKDGLEAKAQLLDITKNTRARFDSETVQEVLRRAKETVQGEAGEEIRALRGELERVAHEDSRRLLLYRSRATTTARRVRQAVVTALNLGLIAALWFITPTNGLSKHPGSVIASLALIAVFFVNVLTYFSLSFGANLSQVVRRIELGLAGRLVDLQCRVAGFDRGASDEEHLPAAVVGS